MSAPTSPKAALRKEFLARRKSLSSQERARLSADTTAHIVSTAEFQQASVVATFVSMGSELDMTASTTAALTAGKTVLVPRLGTGRQIGWSEVTSLARLQPTGTHRPDEPVDAVNLGTAGLAAADLILVPAFYIDASGYRVGRGAAWYDQALLARCTDATLFGIVYPWEHGDAFAFDHEPHDVHVTAVVTADGVTRLR